MKSSRLAALVGLAFSALAGAALFGSAVLGQGSPGVELTTLTAATQVPLGAPCTISCFAKMSSVQAFVNGSGSGGTPGAGSFTTLAASSTVSGAGFTALFASPPAIGGTVAAAGTFTALVGTTINGNTFTTGTGTLTIATGKTLTANNNVTLAGGDGSTVAVAANKTLTVSNSLTLAGTDTTTMTFPSTSATIARTDAGQTFTGVNNFTAPNLTNPVIVGPAPVACGASCAPTAGQLITFAVNSGGTATLPTSSGSGNVIRLRVTITQASGTIKVLLTTTSDVIIGTAIGENAGTAKVFVGNAAANHSIAMPFAGTQPSGGFNGDLITCTDMATGTWACDVVYQAGTTPTTPYSTSTS